MRLKHLIAIVLCVFMTSLKTLAQPYVSYVDIGEFNERNLYSSEYLYTINLPVGGCDLDNSVEFDRFISILSDVLENSYSELIGVYVCVEPHRRMDCGRIMSISVRKGPGKP